MKGTNTFPKHKTNCFILNCATNLRREAQFGPPNEFGVWNLDAPNEAYGLF